MPTPSYELTRLDPNTFEHLANMLALRVLGAGHTGFGPGPDSGRDGYFEGAAPYPSAKRGWKGVWYVQSKFLAPNLSKNPSKWLLDRIAEEIKAFAAPNSSRTWPDNWIIVTNIEPSGAARTGSFDRARALVRKARPELATHFHIWGGRKVLDLLALHPEITEHYAEFVTSGAVLTKLYEDLLSSHAHVEQILRQWIVTQFNEQQYTKLEQAGSTTDNRPGIHRLFTDIPFSSRPNNRQMAATTLARALAQNHRVGTVKLDTRQWRAWQCNPSRARVWFVKGGPGQGKSTLTQYICQIQRAALILAPNGPNVLPAQRSLAEEIQHVATSQGLWPVAPRIPVVVDLKELAFWFGQKSEGTTDRVIAYFVDQLAKQLGENVRAGTLRTAFTKFRWLFIFDGLDEVPGDVKDAVAKEVTHFVDDVLVGLGTDASVVCTSRPQGYSGQFAELDAALIQLVNLSRDEALACAGPLLALDRSETERRSYVKTLQEALQSPAIAEIMTTPLQAHIMAIIVRDGGKPPDRKWQLFDTFYGIIKKREANRNLPDRKLAKLLQQDDKLLRAIHNRLGFELHSRAEISEGAVTSLGRDELKKVVREVVSQLQDTNVDETVATLMRATTERLVLVSTPETGEYVRFDIRPLQEFFAAEQIYQSGEADAFVERVRVIAGDSHWREVMHFLLSALVEQNRKGELAAAVTVLTELDDAGDIDIRALNRRLARGGIIAARLLQEGVLEQDKRVREQFRSCILPLLASFDADRYLSDVKTTHSLKWLTDVLIASLREQAEPETVGAAITLSYILSDSDSRSSDVKNLIMNMSATYQGLFCQGVRRTFGSPRNYLAPHWVIEVVLKFLLRHDWWHVFEHGVGAAIDILDSRKAIIRNVAIESGIEPELATLLAPIVSSKRPYAPNPDTPAFTEKKYGIIELKFYKVDETLNWKTWAPSVWLALESSTGLLQSTYRLFELLRAPSEDGVRALLSSIGGTPRNLRLLPESLRSFLADDVLQGASGPQSVAVGQLVQKDRPGYTKFVFMDEIRANEVPDWKSMIMDKPEIVLHLLIDSAFAVRQPFEDLPLQRLLIQSLRRSTELFDFVPEWGTFFNLPGELGSGLRQLAIESSDVAVQHQYFYRDRIYPFELTLPQDAPLLPHLVNMLAQSTAAPYRFFEREESSFTREQNLPKLVEKYVPERTELIKITQASCFSRRVRAASEILLGLHPASTAPQFSSPPSKEKLVAYYEPGECDWYIPAVAVLLSSAIAEGKQYALETIGALINRAQSDFSARRALSGPLNKWRELAGAPVQKLANPSLWM